MVRCADYECTNSSRNKKSHEVKGYHYIPSNNELRNKWIIVIKREPLYPKNANFAVCGLHLEEDCFLRDLESELIGIKRTFSLKDGAVPTLFAFSKPKQKCISCEQRAEKHKQRNIVENMESEMITETKSPSTSKTGYP